MKRWTGEARRTCETCQSVDVRVWHRQGQLAPDLLFSLTWASADEEFGWVNVITRSDSICLSYKIFRNGRWEWIDQRFSLDWSRCRYGGRRPWLRCGGLPKNSWQCQRRAAKLFRVGDYFACRGCHGLVYASQQEMPLYRNVTQAQKLRQRLGGSEDIFDPFPDKPKGMHWRTFRRLVDRGARLEGAIHSIVGQRFR